MKDLPLEDYFCDCGAQLFLDRGSRDDNVSPGSPRTVYCADCGTDHPLVLIAVDAASRERYRIRRELDDVAKEWAESKETASLRNPGEVFASHLRAALDRIILEEG